MGQRDFSPSRKGEDSRLAAETGSRHAGASTVPCAWHQAKCSPTRCFQPAWPLRVFAKTLAGHVAPSSDSGKRRECSGVQGQGYRIQALCDLLRDPKALQSLGHALHPARRLMLHSPTPATSMPPASPTRNANCPWRIAVACLACSLQWLTSMLVVPRFQLDLGHGPRLS
jgi:hypothetical protein